MASTSTTWGPSSSEKDVPPAVASRSQAARTAACECVGSVRSPRSDGGAAPCFRAHVRDGLGEGPSVPGEVDDGVLSLAVHMIPGVLTTCAPAALTLW